MLAVSLPLQVGLRSSNVFLAGSKKFAPQVALLQKGASIVCGKLAWFPQ